MIQNGTNLFELLWMVFVLLLAMIIGWRRV